jgi:hypothetical protein
MSPMMGFSVLLSLSFLCPARAPALTAPACAQGY